jgi:hypothetical protein
VEDIISRDPHPAQCKEHTTLGAELKYDMSADVSGPDVVFSIHSHRVRCDEQVVGNATDEFARRIEFHERVLAAMK